MRFLVILAAVTLVAGAGADTAWAAVSQAELEALRQELAAGLETQQNNLNHVWTMVAAALVFLMQGGFLLLEAGMVRSKNSINVAQKNIADFIIAGCAFYFLGFGLMFGPSFGGWLGFEMPFWNQRDDWDFTFFVFQLVFCGTAATILSGAVAERMRFSGYLIAAVCVALFIYPVFGHWAWGNLLISDNPAWLADMGFIDFAGSTVVHSVGGWIGLAAIVVAGARIGRFDDDGNALPIHGHSAVLATMGAIVLWVGWIGFNGGSTTAGTPAFAHIISNTILSACFGGAVAMILGRLHDGLHRPVWPINGVLAGLVGITAGCDVLDTFGAIIIGLTSGIVVVYATMFMERRLKLDDAVGAVAVHGVCGAWGTVLLAAIMPAEHLGEAGRLAQIGVQALGVAAAFVWSFGSALVMFKLIDATIGLRVSAAHELEGLNSAEHGTTLGTGLLQKALEDLANGNADMGRRLDETTGDEAAELAYSFNRLMAKLEEMIDGIAAGAQRLVVASDDLNSTSQQLTNSSQGMLSRAEVVSQATESVSGNVTSMANAVSGVNDNVTDISGNAAEVSEHMAVVSAEVQNMAGAMQAIASSAHEAKEIADTAVDSVTQATGTISTLGEASDRIGAVLEAIRRIAKQTRMLALNATVEAERAGEAGKGFAVVAGEVKRLADDTASATEQIEDRVAEIRGGTHQAVDAIAAISSIIDQVNQAIVGISGSADAQIEVSQTISGRVADAESRAGRMAERIREVADTARAVSDEALRAADGTRSVTADLAEVKQAASQTSKGASTVSEASADVSSIADQLRDAVGRLGSAGRLAEPAE
ncbi:ammonium transporter [Pelagibius marinus]|uniref:ammonium transporter n=1 Tax=Pelagibius marinus TaxID=2762760 RepID=UPI0018724065|nr:ammonium transporter [Pelagibius marinus]